MVNKTVRENTARSLAGTYTIDPDSSHIGFEARHAMVTKVRGSFFDFAGTAVLHGEDPALSKIELTIEVASLGTGNHKRDDHLRTNDFLDAENFPTLTLKSTSLKKVTDTDWTLTTDLTIRGVTKSVDFALEYLGQGDAMAEGKKVVAFSAVAEIDRRDFGVVFNHSLLDGSVVVGNRVKLELEIEAALAE
jgi:polyisoprenoid-binding protein YceI